MVATPVHRYASPLPWSRSDPIKTIAALRSLATWQKRQKRITPRTWPTTTWKNTHQNLTPPASADSTYILLFSFFTAPQSVKKSPHNRLRKNLLSKDTLQHITLEISLRHNEPLPTQNSLWLRSPILRDSPRSLLHGQLPLQIQQPWPGLDFTTNSTILTLAPKT